MSKALFFVCSHTLCLPHNMQELLTDLR